MGRAADIGLRISRCAGWTERVLARAPRRVPNSVLSVADQVVASATTFVTGVLIGRVCTKEEFGLYTVGFSLLTVLMAVQASLIATPFMIRYPRLTGDDGRRFAGSSFAHQCAFAAVVSALVLISGLSCFGHNPALAQTISALGAALAFLLLRDYVRQNCFARLAYAKALLLDVLLAALQIVGLVALYLTGALHSWSAFLVLGMSSAVTAFHWFIVTRHERIVTRSAIAEDFARNWTAGKWLLASGVAWALSMNLYAWIVAGFHGAAMAGTWAAALGVMTLINPLMLGVQNYLGPRIMHARADGGVRRLQRVVRDSAIAFCGMLLVFTGAMAIAGDSLVTLVYGAKYAGNGLLVVLLSLNAAVLTVGFVVSRGLFALELARIDFYVNFIALASFLLIGVALVRWSGPVGAAAAQLITNSAATAIRSAAFANASGRLAREAA
ncbi:MAG: oligosaccharide flippase family protein [Candidatus Hydrogenedentes bacterium]|nr:oligosaccharide flippase family protein [Candidatus Hydrogenedentota bacterium]